MNDDATTLPARADAGGPTLDAASGWCTGVRLSPTPNCDARPSGAEVDLLVIHAISLPPGQFGGGAIEDLFLNRLDCSAHPWFEGLRGLRVSAHFLVERAGAITQYVSTLDRAWHAGASTFEGRERCNDFSIGIELEGSDETAFTALQYRRLAALTRTILAVHPGIAAGRIIGHSDIAPGRKTDPGPHFDWRRYRAALAVAE